MDGCRPYKIMDIKRFFASIEDVGSERIYLRNQEFLHAKKVLRQKVGYLVIVCCGDGYDYHGVIEEITNDYIVVKITEKVLNKNETKVPITLYQCVAKESDFIVQKAVELGVTEYVPVISQYVNAKFNQQKAEAIAIQASKQCERAKIMSVREPITLDVALEECVKYDACVFPYENATEGKIAKCVSMNTKSVAILIGCEGGFAPTEADMAIKSGYDAVTLGSRILRAETASIVTIGLVLDALGEMA